MKNLTFISFIIICTLFSCKTKESENIQSEKTSPINEVIKDSDNWISELKNKISSFKMLSHKEIISPNNDSLKVYLYKDEKDVPRIVKYTIKDDAGKLSGYAYYYFDKEGKVFANQIPLDSEEDYFRLFPKDGKVILYSKKKDDIKVSACDELCSSSKNSIAAKEIATLMQFFPKIEYSVPQLSSKTMPILRTFKDSILLKELPNSNSKTVEILKDNTHLKYLGDNGKQDIVDGKSWVWYKVENPQGIKGWIFGHPEYVDDLNDENWW